jgi:hypothetical protein
LVATITCSLTNHTTSPGGCKGSRTNRTAVATMASSARPEDRFAVLADNLEMDPMVPEIACACLHLGHKPQDRMGDRHLCREQRVELAQKVQPAFLGQVCGVR